MTDFKLGDHVVNRFGPICPGIITETLEMTNFGPMHGRVKVRYARGGSSWVSPDHLRRESYVGWEL